MSPLCAPSEFPEIIPTRTYFIRKANCYKELNRLSPFACPRLPPGYIAGSPELGAEISASTVRADMESKFTAYRRNEIREYLVKGRLKTSHHGAPQNQPGFAASEPRLDPTISRRVHQIATMRNVPIPVASLLLFPRQQREASGVQGAAMSPLVAVRMPRKTCRMPTATNHALGCSTCLLLFPGGRPGWF